MTAAWESSAPEQSSRAARRAVAMAAASMVIIGLVLLYMLMQATNNRDLYERNYALLFSINVAVAALLFSAIAWVAYRLAVRLRQRRFGSRLLLKIAATFALVGFAPGLLIYVVSYQFVSRSIETWFDVKVEGALDAGLNLGRVTLDTLSRDLAGKVRTAANQWTDTTDPLSLQRMGEQMGATEVAVWSGSGNLIATTAQANFQLTPDKPSSSQFRTARTERELAWIDGLDAGPEGADNARIRVLVPLPISQLGLNPESRFLLVSKALPRTLVDYALAVESANREYQERALAREGLKRMYIGTLTLSLFLAVFGAVLLAVLLGNQIAKPLLVLAEGVNQVAAGDLRPKLSMQGNDELEGLTRAFASMTAQLADAREAVEHSMAQVDASRAHLQTILDNLTAGVIVMGDDGALRSFNPGAVRILRSELDAFVGRHLAEVPGLDDMGHQVQRRFAELLQHRGEAGYDHWQESFELRPDGGTAHGPFDRALTLVARGAALPGNALLLVFDDISDIVSAQRAQAWGEVARRLAHEIKNPLTPIQLSAERLEMKLAGKLGAAEDAVLAKSVKTIVDQVDAMKRLVNEFRDYARLPTAQLQPLDLNALVRDVMALYEDQSSAVPVALELDPNCPPVMGDAEQLRQVIHNLLQNAQDATEALGSEGPSDKVPVDATGEARVVRLRTQWQAASHRVRLIVQDSGGGFPEAILKRAFEPYVTTKARGTGLGLAVVKKIADEHGARIDITNRTTDGKVVGAQVSLSLVAENAESA